MPSRNRDGGLTCVASETILKGQRVTPVTTTVSGDTSGKMVIALRDDAHGSAEPWGEWLPFMGTAASDANVGDIIPVTPIHFGACDVLVDIPAAWAQNLVTGTWLYTQAGSANFSVAGTWDASDRQVPVGVITTTGVNVAPSASAVTTVLLKGFISRWLWDKVYV